MPGAPSFVYVYSYVIGWLLPPMIHIAAYYLGMTNNEMFNATAKTLCLVVTTLFYGCYVAFLAKDDSATRYRVATIDIDDGVVYDMFDTAMDSHNASSAVEGSSSTNTASIDSATAAGASTCADTDSSSSHSPATASASQTRRDSSAIIMSMSRHRAAWMRTSRRIDAATAAQAANHQVTAAEHEHTDAFVHFFEQHELLPRWWFPKLGERPGAYVTAKNKNWHFVLTFCFYTGWVVIYGILMVMDMFMLMMLMLFEVDVCSNRNRRDIMMTHICVFMCVALLLVLCDAVSRQSRGGPHQVVLGLCRRECAVQDDHEAHRSQSGQR